MRDVLGFVSAHDSVFLLGLSVLSLALVVQNISLSRRLARLSRRRERRFDEARAEDVLDALEEQAQAVAVVSRRVDELDESHRRAVSELSGCLQNVGLVRFNAFEDVGGEQSFALALLNKGRNGVVVSSLYGRQDARLYAKSISNGEGERPLSDEERRAVEQAIA